MLCTIIVSSAQSAGQMLGVIVTLAMGLALSATLECPIVANGLAAMGFVRKNLILLH